MHVLVAKEYLKGQTPLAGEYALYKDEDKCYFVVGDGVNTVENTSFPILSIPENVFSSMKNLGEKYPPNKGPYKWEDWEIEPEFEKTLLYKDSCVSWSELRNYMKSGLNDFYAIHVEDVYYFTNPLNISDFQNKNGKVLTRAPQSWCYCEVSEN